MNLEFISKKNSIESGSGQYILYWMQNSFRVENNGALNYAISLANENHLPLIVFTVLNSETLRYDRHGKFLLEGMAEVEEKLSEFKIKYVVWNTDPIEGISSMSKTAFAVVADRGYLKESRNLIERAESVLPCSLRVVESNVVIPVESASLKEEYTAGTFRKKVSGRLSNYLKLYKKILPVKSSLDLNIAGISLSNRQGIADSLEKTPALKMNIRGGYSEAKKLLNSFIKNKLKDYDEKRSDPGLDYFSGLSPYLRYGNISPAEVAVKAMDSGIDHIAQFLDELIIRRELSINFVYYNSNYDSLKSLPDWAKKTLINHENYPRDYIYSKSEFENHKTHDRFWNAAQYELVQHGRIHNYMRMYWGKKIIEWTDSPDDAIRIMIYLNNKYALDGNDPNSYAGILWCFGKHDRAWGERPVFGKVRYMNDRGLTRKFKMDRYFRRIGFKGEDKQLTLGEAND